jgi:ATP:corrinoid adenosyltransferase
MPAITTPPLALIRPTSPGEHAELATLHQLAQGLPDSFHLFHSVDWSQAHPGGDQHGELDIVVVNAAGDVAVLEVKAGTLDLTEGQVAKWYAGQRKDVGRQAQWQFSALLHRLRQEGLVVRLSHFLVLPHQRVQQGTVAYPRERIADADDYRNLADFLLQRLGTGLPDAEMHERVCAFMHNRIALKPDLSALKNSLQHRVQAISGGLATWVMRMQAPQGVIQVHGTAGSGKSQLALQLLQQARSKGRRAAYVCFTRELADQMRDAAPAACAVDTFHQLCWEVAGRPALVSDYDALSQTYLETLTGREPDLDLLVIDELQDMQAAWLSGLLSRLREQGQVVLLGDPEQSLYTDREEFEIPEAVLVRTQENFRSPRQVVATINQLRLTEEPIEASSPFMGELPGMHEYVQGNERALRRQTELAVRRCLERGYALQDIVILSLHGRDSSALLAGDRLGDWPLIRFTGGYDAGEPIWTQGELRIDTVRRFKGRCAPAVVLTEIDFTQIETLQRRLLFVGMTRAQMHLELVMSDGAQAALVGQLR